MDLQLKGHRAIVTGSSAGIGEAIARKLAAEGAAVIVHGRRPHAVSVVAQAISANGGQAEGLTADLADPGDCARLATSAANACADRRRGSPVTLCDGHGRSRSLRYGPLPGPGLRRRGSGGGEHAPAGASLLRTRR